MAALSKINFRKEIFKKFLFELNKKIVMLESKAKLQQSKSEKYLKFFLVNSIILNANFDINKFSHFTEISLNKNKTSPCCYIRKTEFKITLKLCNLQ